MLGPRVLTVIHERGKLRFIMEKIKVMAVGRESVASQVGLRGFELIKVICYLFE